MPWHEVSTMSLRYEFVMLAMREDANYPKKNGHDCTKQQSPI